MDRPSIRDKRGFTLTEIMIALAVFTIGILSVNAMQTASIKGNSRANRLTEATNCAVGQMEELMTLDYGNSLLNDDNDSATYQTADGQTGTADGNTTSGDGVYSIFWNVNENTPTDNSKTIEVIVTWQDMGGQKSLTMNTIKSTI